MKVKAKDALKAQAKDDSLWPAAKGRAVGGGPHTPRVVCPHVRGLEADGSYEPSEPLADRIEAARKASSPTAEQRELASWQLAEGTVDDGA